ncbi:MAG: SpoIIE family protein phosphatase [Planctomycetaceae bacterium]
MEVKNEQGEMFGNDKVIELLKAHKDKSSAELVDLLINTALEYSQRPIPVDDMTVVVLKYEG